MSNSLIVSRLDSLVKDLANYIYLIYKRLYHSQLEIKVNIGDENDNILDIYIELITYASGMDIEIHLSANYDINSQTLGPLYGDYIDDITNISPRTNKYILSPDKGPFYGQLSPELHNRIRNKALEAIDEHLGRP
jgi:hypothetical protein